ncbi:hypothetical protein [Sphingomonas nostoxanthinifaciens]|uniref:hypothetical protein n=1 Tax=Sphingomonas nostoxanthinifaciens TaxID=2872652 RepID=UPI001CC1D62E|nr:hypothetical protein [Sphingomonas nostoxanthinifaciens]UAK26182.1 hypothetical protein K8P63_08825 [Sphingomonas nostoxanthinifaciens]
MYDDVMHPHPAPLSWRDIEALPFIMLGMLALGAVAYALTYAGPALQADTIKVASIAALLGLRHAVLGRVASAPE